MVGCLLLFLTLALLQNGQVTPLGQRHCTNQAFPLLLSGNLWKYSSNVMPVRKLLPDALVVLMAFIVFNMLQLWHITA